MKKIINYKKHISKIRKYEKEYHNNLYKTSELGEKGTWLFKPIQSIIDIINNFPNKNIKVLDIGCGVGRHSIPIAKKIQNYGGIIIGIDILYSAIKKFKENIKKNNINKNTIILKKIDIDNYNIDIGNFDYIFAVSCLEHSSSIYKLKKILHNMTNGTKNGGYNYIIMSVDNILYDPINNKNLEAMVEINLTLDNAKNLLDKYYSSWEKVKYSIEPWQSIQTHTKKEYIQKGNSIRLIYKKITN